VDARSWRLSGQVNAPGTGHVTTRFSVQDVTAGDRWVARDVRGTAVDVGDRSWLLVTGLINGHTYRWSMFERAGSRVSPATAWSTFTVDTTVVPAPAVRSSDYRASRWNLARLARGNFWWTDSSRDVRGWEYREDGANWSLPTTAASLTWNPAGPGPHVLQVRAVNSAGLPGTAASYRFATYNEGGRPRRPAEPIERSGRPASAAASCSIGSLDSPLNVEQQSPSTVLLAASAPAGSCEYVEYNYAVKGTGLGGNGCAGPAFCGIPASDLVFATSGKQPPSWPVYLDTADSNGTTWTWPTVRWNIEQTLANGGFLTEGNTTVSVQACWYSGDSQSDWVGCSSQLGSVNYDPAGFTGSGADTTIGPGTLNLASGDFDVQSTDATGPSPYGDITVSRDMSSFPPSPAAPYSGFGPGWNADFAGSAGGIANDSVSIFVGTESPAQSDVYLTGDDGDFEWYQAPSQTYPITDFQGQGAAATNGSTLQLGYNAQDVLTLTVTERDGTQVEWTVIAVPGEADEYTGELSAIVQPGGAATQYLENSSGQVTTIVAPAPPGVTCSPASAPATPGCRSLTIDYATATTATGTAQGQWGNYQGNISDITYNAANPTSPSSMQSITVAGYQYDDTGLLREYYDPRVTGCSSAPCLPTIYSYNAVTSFLTDNQDQNDYAYYRLASLTPPGVNAWDFGYDAYGRLATVQRADPGGGTDTTTVIYNVPLSGTGLPGPNPLSAPESFEPGQNASYTSDGGYLGGTGSPATATAIFRPTGPAVTDTYDTHGNPAGVPSAGDWAEATISYMDDNGYLVDTAGYGDGAWQIGYTNYDQDLSGRVTSTVSAQAVDECSDPAAYPGMDPYAASQSSSACFTLLGTTNTYSTTVPAELLRSPAPPTWSCPAPTAPPPRHSAALRRPLTWSTARWSPATPTTRARRRAGHTTCQRP
jgi:hypothetical protein